MGRFSSKRLLITGAGGFLGAATVRSALAAGHEPIALVRTPGAARLAGLDVAIHAVDLSDTAGVARLLAKMKPEVVIHCAWEGVGGAQRAGDIQLQNIGTTLALADAAITAGAQRFVGIGSQAEYGRHDRRIDESAATEPFLLYGAAKLSACHLARQRCAEAGVDFAWLRLFAAYGRGDNPDWLIPSVTRQIVAGQAPRTSPGTQRWDYLYIDDAAAGVLAAATTDGATGVFNLSSGASVPVRAIIETIRDLARPGLPLTFGQIPFGPNQIMHLEGDSGRLAAATGWRPTIALPDGLADVVASARIAA